MQEFLKADIFFFIASVATVAFTGALVMALVYAIRILQKVDVISGTVQQEVKNITADVAKARAEIKEKSTVSNLARFIGEAFSAIQGAKKAGSKRSRASNGKKRSV